MARAAASPRMDLFSIYLYWANHVPSVCVCDRLFFFFVEVVHMALTYNMSLATCANSSISFGTTCMMRGFADEGA